MVFGFEIPSKNQMGGGNIGLSARKGRFGKLLGRFMRMKQIQGETKMTWTVGFKRLVFGKPYVQMNYVSRAYIPVSITIISFIEAVSSRFLFFANKSFQYRIH